MEMKYPVGIPYWEAKGPGRGWWGPPRGTHGAGDETVVAVVVKKLAEKIADAKVEHHYIIDSDGNVIASIEGERTHVVISGEDVAKLAGNTTLHNHPGVGPSFSLGDIELACQENEKESYVVSSGLGKRYLYRFAPGPGIRNRPTLSAELRKINSDVFHETSTALFEGRINAERATYYHEHDVWTHANQFYANKGLDFGYSREEL